MLDGNIEQPRRKTVDDNLLTIRALIPLVLIGYLIALLALLVSGWPTGQFGQQNVETVRHFERITRPLVGESEESFTLARRILDVAFYLVLLAGFAFLVITWRRGNRSPLMGLIGVGILGLSYVSGMSLYNGAFISMCGFLLILFGGIVMLTAVRDDEAVEDTVVVVENKVEDETAEESPSTIGGTPSVSSDITDSEQTQI